MCERLSADRIGLEARALVALRSGRLDGTSSYVLRLSANDNETPR
jgi:hypothetical protein